MQGVSGPGWPSLAVGQLRCPPWLSGGQYYLQHRSSWSTSPLWAVLQEVLGPVTYVDEKSTAPAPIEEMESSLFHEGQTPTPSDEWYLFPQMIPSDGSSRGQPAMWTAVAIQPETDTIWFNTAVVRVASGQNCKMCSSWLPMKHCP